MVPFYKGTNHFLVELNGTREADGLASQSLDARSERQVVTLDTLGEYLPGQMHLARHLSGIASPTASLHWYQRHPCRSRYAKLSPFLKLAGLEW